MTPKACEEKEPFKFVNTVASGCSKNRAMFNILEQVQKPKAPVVPMAIRTCEYNMTEGGIPAANIMSLCSANSASYMSPVQTNDSAMLRGYGEE